MSTATTTRFGRFADRLRDIGPSPIRAIFDKAAALEAAGEKVYHFEIGRPDFDTPQVAKDAAAASLDRGEVHYGPNAGTIDLRARHQRVSSGPAGDHLRPGLGSPRHDRRQRGRVPGTDGFLRTRR